MYQDPVGYQDIITGVVLEGTSRDAVLKFHIVSGGVVITIWCAKVETKSLSHAFTNTSFFLKNSCSI